METFQAGGALEKVKVWLVPRAGLEGQSVRLRGLQRVKVCAVVVVARRESEAARARVVSGDFMVVEV